MLFENLPQELQERIFTFLDGGCLARALKVCKRWKEIIRHLSRVTDLWQICCSREIPKEIILELCGNRDINDAGVLTADASPTFLADWNRIYGEWFSTCNIGVWANHTTRFSAFDSIPITCCKLSGNWILTGHRNGSVCAWYTTTGKIMRVVGQHLKMVTDIAPVDILKEGPYGSPDITSAHHHVVSVSKDHTIQVCTLIPEDMEVTKFVIRHHSDNLESVRVFGSSFAVSCMDNSVSVWRMYPPMHPSAPMEISLKFILRGPEDILRWIGFWQDRVLCLCHNAVLKVFALDVEDWASSHRPLLRCSPRLLVPATTSDFEDYTLIMTNAFLFREKTVFMLTVDRQLWISVDGHHYCQYHTMEVLQSYVVCVALRGRLLALGMERGMVLVFHLPNQDSLLHLNLKKPQWSQQLSEASIISVDIGSDDCHPVIVATTSETVYVIKWTVANNTTSEETS